uniref:Uncharacterized protein n=1 Tax=Globodera pallida TaxID=36090 RepID=A0A183BVF0_GLOPA
MKEFLFHLALELIDCKCRVESDWCDILAKLCSQDHIVSALLPELSNAMIFITLIPLQLMAIVIAAVFVIIAQCCGRRKKGGAFKSRARKAPAKKGGLFKSPAKKAAAKKGVQSKTPAKKAPESPPPAKKANSRKEDS